MSPKSVIYTPQLDEWGIPILFHVVGALPGKWLPSCKEMTMKDASIRLIRENGKTTGRYKTQVTSQVQVTALLIDTWDKQFPLKLKVFRGLWSALRDTFTFYLYSGPPLLPVTCDLHFVAVGRGKWGKFWLNWRSCMFYLKTHSDHASRECFYF